MYNSYVINRNPRKLLKKSIHLQHLQASRKSTNLICSGGGKLEQYNLQIINQFHQVPHTFQIISEFGDDLILTKKYLSVKKRTNHKVYSNESVYSLKKPQRHPKKSLHEFLNLSFYAINYIKRALKKNDSFNNLPSWFGSPLKHADIHNRRNEKKYNSFNDLPEAATNNLSQRGHSFYGENNSKQAFNFKSSKNSFNFKHKKNHSYSRKMNFKNIPSIENNHSKMQKRNEFTVLRVTDSWNYNNDAMETSEEKLCSSTSTCSSSSNLREYYLPKRSCSIDTMKVATVLAKHKLFELANSKDEFKSKGNKKIKKNKSDISINRQNSNLTTICFDSPIKKDIITLNNAINDLHKKNEQQLATLMEGNVLLNKFCNLVVKKKSRHILPNLSRIRKKKFTKIIDDDSSINGTNDDEKYKKKFEEVSQIGSNKITESIFSNETIRCHSKLRPCLTSPSSIELFKTIAGSKKQKEKNIYKYVDKKPEIESEDKKKGIKFILNSKPSGLKQTIPKLQNLNKSDDSISSENLKESNTTTYESGSCKNPIDTYSTNSINMGQYENKEAHKNSRTWLCPSDDSLNFPQKTFIKLDHFFDMGLKNPKIAKLIVPSKILVKGSDSEINEETKENEITVKDNQEILQLNILEDYSRNNKVIESLNGVKDIKPRRNVASNDAIVFTNSIVYGSDVFKKMKEKFDLIENEKVKSYLSQDSGTNGSKENNKESSHFSLSYNSNMSSNIKEQSITSKKSETFDTIDKLNCSNRKITNALSLDRLSTLYSKSNKNQFENNKTVSFESKNSLKKDSYVKVQNNSKSHETNNRNKTNNEKINSLTQKGKKLSNASILKNNSGALEKISLENLNKRNPENKHIGLTEMIYKSNSSNPMQMSTRIPNENISEKGTQADFYQTDQLKKKEDDKICAEQDKLKNAQESMKNTPNIMSGKIVTNGGKAVVLYNGSGYPITDLNGKILKNNLGSYLLFTDNYDEIIKSKVPVFDRDYISVSNSNFEPTKVPQIKNKFKITDRSGNPVSLFNNVGWPLTNEDGNFLHDNRGNLLVKMDEYNSPVRCLNGSSVYLKNGAMFFAQKLKFVVTPLETSPTNSTAGISDKSRIITQEGIKSSTFKARTRINNGMLPSEYKQPPSEPESRKLKRNQQKIITSRSQRFGITPQISIPIFDLEGNRLTDDNGNPLKDQYGECMLLLDENGFGISDLRGGPIFDSDGKQILLKDMYDRYKPPALNYFADRLTRLRQTCSETTNNTFENSEEETSFYDLTLASTQNSEHIMPYINANNTLSFDVDTNSIDWNRGDIFYKSRNIQENYVMPLNEIQPYSQLSSVENNSVFYPLESDENCFRRYYEPYNRHQIRGYIPNSYEQNQDNFFFDQLSEMNNYQNGNYYNNYDIPITGKRFENNSDIQYVIDQNEYICQY